MPTRIAVIIAFTLFFTLFNHPGNAVVYAVECSASVSPQNILENTFENLVFRVNNSSSGDTYKWVKISIGSEDIDLNNPSADGWSSSGDRSQAIFRSGSGGIGPGQSQNFNTNESGIGFAPATVSVNVEASTNAGGSGAGSCGGVTINIVTELPLESDEPTSTPTPAPSSSTTTSTSTTTTTTTTVTVTVTPTPKPTPKPDKIAPVISLDTEFDKPFKEAPKIIGKATDGDSGGVSGGVSSVDYSIDDGKNWLSVDEAESVKGKGEREKTFEFTPAVFEDGDYKVKVRAKDPSGNVGYSSVKTMVVDRLPPQVGGVLFSIGPQVLMPDKDGIIYTLQGLGIKVTLSAVGGPTEIEILSDQGVKQGLAKNTESGLWSGSLNFSEPGIYQLKAHSIDGAKNETDRILNSVVVLEPGEVTKNATVAVYYFEPDSQRFLLWDGKPFGQQNPQKTDEQGEYRLLVPPGKYYLQISALGFNSLKSAIFTLDRSLPINNNFQLEAARGFRVGPLNFFLPNFSQKMVDIKFSPPAIPEEAKINSKLDGKELPIVDLKSDSKSISTVSLRGKQTILTILSSWLPQSFEQLAILDLLTSQKEMQTLVVISQETASSVNLFQKRGGYTLPFLADPDGLLVEPLKVQTLPMHIFLNRKGVIKNVRMGVLTKDELLNNLVN